MQNERAIRNLDYNSQVILINSSIWSGKIEARFGECNPNNQTNIHHSVADGETLTRGTLSPLRVKKIILPAGSPNAPYHQLAGPNLLAGSADTRAQNVEPAVV